MDIFLKRFFPSVYRKASAEAAHESAYCKFNSHLLQFFTSSLYLAALVASFVASVITKKFGRRMSMFIGGVTFLVGSILNGFAQNVIMLIIGRIFLGIGVGFCNQVITCNIISGRGLLDPQVYLAYELNISCRQRMIKLIKY